MIDAQPMLQSAVYPFMHVDDKLAGENGDEMRHEYIAGELALGTIDDSLYPLFRDPSRMRLLAGPCQTRPIPLIRRDAAARA